MKLLVAADLHIGKNGFGVTPEVWNAPLQDVLDYVKEHSTDYVVIVGDAFHKRHPLTDEYKLYRDWVRALEAQSVTVIDIAGNHDRGVTAPSIPGSAANAAGPAFLGVSTPVGWVEPTRMPCSANSGARDWLRPVRPHLDAA